MKEEALKLADELANEKSEKWITRQEASAMIRRLVEELENERRKAKAFRQSNQAADTQIKALVEELDKPHPKCDKACMYLCQTKPLSDEEIWELHQEHIDEIPCGHSMKTIGFVEFARAIEERHGIK